MSPDTSRVRLELARSRRPALLLALLALAGAFGTWFMLRNQFATWPWQHRYTVRVAVPSAKGIHPGTQQEVRIAGLRVGTIADVQRVRGRPVLTLSIEPRYGPLYGDARVRLRPATALQDMYVEIADRGHRRAGRLDGGRVLPASRAQTPVDPSEVLDVFDPRTRTRMAGMLSALRTGLAPPAGRQLDAAFVQLAPFLATTARFTRALATNRARVKRLVHNLSALTTAVGQRDRDLTAFVRRADTTLAALDQRQALGATLAELPPTLSALRTTLSRVRGARRRLDPALAALLPTAGALDSGLRALDTASARGARSLATLRPALAPLRRLAGVLPPTATALRDGMRDLEPQVPAVDRVTGAVLRCQASVQKFFQWTLSVVKFFDAYGVRARGVARFGLDTPDGRLLDPNYVIPTKSCVPGGTQ